MGLSARGKGKVALRGQYCEDQGSLRGGSYQQPKWAPPPPGRVASAPEDPLAKCLNSSLPAKLPFEGQARAGAYASALC